MHTDEYEIALYREKDVCVGQVRRCQRVLDSMEARHGMTTAAFLDRDRRGELPASAGFQEWRAGSEALRRWQETLAEYERLLDIMRISAS